MISNTLPSPSLERDSSLDTALAVVLSSLVPPWSDVEVVHDPAEYTPEELDAFHAFFVHIRVQAPSPRGPVQANIFTMTEPWAREHTLAFFNRFSSLILDPIATDGEDQDAPLHTHTLLHFCSAYPIPPMIEYIFQRNWAPGRLEAHLLPLFSLADFTPQACPALAEEAARRLSATFSVPVDLHSEETIETLNTLLLESVRPCERPDLALPSNTHQPIGVLTQVGVALGTLLCNLHPEHIRWIAPPEDIDSQFPVLEVPAPNATDDDQNPGSSFIFPFDKVFQVYQNGDDRNLLTYYNVIVANALNRSGLPLQNDTTFDDASPHLLPVLKTPEWHTQHNLVGCDLYENGPTGTPSVTLAMDQPDQIAFVSNDRLTSWERDAPSLIAHACANLARITPDPIEHFESIEIEGSSVFRLEYNDYFNASRIMLPELLFEALQTLAPEAVVFVVAVPNRDHLIAVPASPENNPTFIHLTQWLHERQPAPVSSVCFLLGAEGLIGYYGLRQDA